MSNARNKARKAGITRRTLLRGLLGGLGVSVALPPLELFMNGNGSAYAGSSAFPTRFGIWYWGNGVLPDRWTPTGEGANWTPSPLLMPLVGVKPNITVVTGTRIATNNTAPHGSGPAGLFTGDDQKNGTVVGPSIDQIIAKQVGDATRFRSLEVGVQRATSGLSYSGPNQVNPPETSPRALFNRLFVDGYRAPGDMSKPDPKILLRRSVLDAVTAQAGRLRQRLGVNDQTRLDAHLDGIRDLETQLDRLQMAPPQLAACSKPQMPLDDYPDIAGRAQMSTVSRVVSDIVAMALACDQTRVFTNMFSQPVNNVLYPDAMAGHHQLTHDEADPQPQVQAILLYVMAELAYFIDALRKVPEGDGTLLDHSVVLCTTDCSFGRTHAIDNYPIILAGGANGALKTGIHYHSAGGEIATKVSLTLLRTMGVRAQSFGAGPGLVSDGLTAITT